MGEIEERTRIEEETGNALNLVGIKYTNKIIYAIVSSGYATLHEIEEYYDLEDILVLYEIFRVSMYNKRQISQNKKGGK